MTEYIKLEAAVSIADYAVDEHPYDKNPEKPETFSEYNRGWHDACDHVHYSLEELPAADVAPVRHGRWFDGEDDDYGSYVTCSICKEDFVCWEADCARTNYCPNCGAKMDGGTDNVYLGV